MSWEALGAIGELVGAIGVIATLVYLAAQVRHNTQAMHSATLNEVTRAQVNELRWSSDISTSMRRALETPDEMTPDDTWKVTEWMTAAFLARQNELHQYRQGLLVKAEWERSAQILRILAGIPWVQEWWETYGRHVYTDEFVQWVDEIQAGDTFDLAAAIRDLEDRSGK